MPRILIGEFAGITRLGLKEFLEEQGFDVISEQVGVVSVAEKLAETQPAVVLVDLDTAEGLAIARQTTSEFPAIKVVACSSQHPIMRVFPPFGRGESYVSELTLTSLAETVRNAPDER